MKPPALVAWEYGPKALGALAEEITSISVVIAFLLSFSFSPGFSPVVRRKLKPMNRFNGLPGAATMSDFARRKPVPDAHTLVGHKHASRCARPLVQPTSLWER